MIDWVKFNSLITKREYYEKNPEEMLTTLIDCWPDNMLKNILRKSKERVYEGLIPILEKELIKRGLK